MRVTKKYLREIILNEINNIVTEMCGPCAAGAEGDGHGDVNLMSRVSPDVLPDDGPGSPLTKQEALKAVMAIANDTSCPVTRSALEDIVNNLSSEQEYEDHDYDTGMEVLHSDHGGQSCGEAHPSESHDSWVSGGQARVPNLGSLDPHSAFGPGHGVGSGEINDYTISGE